MKVSFMMMNVLLAATLLVSCGGKDKKDGGKTGTGSSKESKKEELDGAWEIKRAEGSMAEMNVGTIYTFDEKKLILSQGSFKNPGTTVITDTSFTFQADGNELKFDYRYKFNGDTLVVRVVNGDQVFHLVKK